MLLSLLERLALRRRRPGQPPRVDRGGVRRLHRPALPEARTAKYPVVLREALRPGESLVITHTKQRQG